MNEPVMNSNQRPTRVIPKSQVGQFMQALAKRARKRYARGWHPVCEFRTPKDAIECNQSATHVDHNAKPLCADHAAEATGSYIERFR